MDHLDVRGSDSEIDLESGGYTSEDDVGEHQNFGSGKKGLHRVYTEIVGQETSDASVKDVQSSCSLAEVLSCDEILVKNGDIWPDKFRGEVANFAEKKNVHEKQNMSNSKSNRPPKPPRPPGGPSLDPADMKLVKEISELATLKRKRTERRKALQKLRKEKTSSMSSNLIALVVTALFFLVIIFQGLLGSRV